MHALNFSSSKCIEIFKLWKISPRKIVISKAKDTKHFSQRIETFILRNICHTFIRLSLWIFCSRYFGLFFRFSTQNIKNFWRIPRFGFFKNSFRTSKLHFYVLTLQLSFSKILITLKKIAAKTFTFYNVISNLCNLIEFSYFCKIKFFWFVGIKHCRSVLLHKKLKYY